MKFLITLLLCGGMLMAGAQEDMIKKQLDDFATAVIKKDKAALSKMLADDVVYSHSNGLHETKAQAIAAFEVAKYEKFDYKPQLIRIYGNTAVVKGDIDILNAASSPTPTQLNVLQIWVKNGSQWQLVARQATRRTPPPAK
ncbi:hypothetical protein F183_A43080 [Bryobacterales bacterium F-183]|nr:hypothetical protein F183_A43080 [Bryobacterales bacterium F-183]